MAEAAWMNRALDADQRAALLVAAMTQDEKLTIVCGHLGASIGGMTAPEGAIGSAGFVPGVERLGIPALQETDASLGVANLRRGDGATALACGLSLASTWDEALAREAGAMIGAEARAKGYNVMLAGGVNLTREPRCGRNFEYLGEDPLLSGVLCGASIEGIQSNHIVSTIKHFALNAQETGRMGLSVEMDEAAMRESDLLAFEIAIERGAPGSVMTAYNRITGDYAGEHDFLLNRVLKGDWGWRGWTMSDWGGCHSGAKAANAGLDQESGRELDKEAFFDAPLRAALQSGEVSAARLDDMATRIVRSLFACGVMDDPPQRGAAIDRSAHEAIGLRAAEQGIVLLKNDGALPLTNAASIAVIGGHADVGVLSGGGSSQVIPWDGWALRIKTDKDYVRRIYHPSSPIQALEALLPNARITFASGEDTEAAVALARASDVAIVFAEQWMTESRDAEDLSLPDGQDALIDAVASANAKTIVILETGNPVLMPWLDRVAAVLAAWYPGGKGGEAIARVLTGAVNPSGRLPMTFPARVNDLPNPELPGAGKGERDKFEARYPEGADVGYRWFAREKHKPLFAFGFGLSYTSFAYTNLKVEGGDTLTASFDVTNSGARAGAEVAQVYLTDAASEATTRLIGWAKVLLAPGETKRITVRADPRLLARYDVGAKNWRVAKGRYTLAVGASATDHKLTGAADIAERRIKA